MNKNYKYFSVFLFSIFLSLFSILSCSAAPSDGFSLTVSPALFQLSLTPGESLSSSINVINNNSYAVDLYASSMNFEVKGEDGKGNFIPLSGNATTSYSLASWLTVPKEPIHILAEKTGAIPFTLHIPKDAEPGGHYGAILTGNQPNVKTSGNAVKISSSISTLFLVKVTGEMIEKGGIRELSLDKNFYQEPKVKFTLRFENKGNVHLIPRGEIAIYNMWGKERGKILVNQDSDFGNVLPMSIRKFAFEWTGENNFFEVGRYKAVAGVSFGDVTKQTDYREVYFWVIPLAPLAKILTFLIVFIAFLVWSIKRYIRRALSLESERVGMTYDFETSKPASTLSESKDYGVMKEKIASIKSVSLQQPTELKVETLIRPIALGVVDLRSALLKAPETKEKGNHKKVQEELTLSVFVRKYTIFLISLILILVGIYGIKIYFGQVLTNQRDFNVKEEREDGGVIKTSAETQVKEGDIKLEN
jgi:hypothetical protein